MRILLTRPAGRSAASAAGLVALGHQALSAPVIEIVMRSPTIAASGFDAAITTSARALQLPGAIVAQLASLPLYVVGERTASAARARGWTKIAAVAKDSRDLATMLLASDAANWLYLAGCPRSPALEQALAAAGRRVFPAIVYEARAVDDLPPPAAGALARAEVDAVLHYSAHSAAIFVDLARRAGLEQQAAAILHVAISPRAAVPLQGFAPCLRIASRPDEQGLFDQLDASA